MAEIKFPEAVPGAMPEHAGARRPRELCKRLEACGFTARQAADLAARLEGIQAVRTGWSLTEIESLLFLRWLVGHGRLGDVLTETS